MVWRVVELLSCAECECVNVQLCLNLSRQIRSFSPSAATYKPANILSEAAATYLLFSVSISLKSLFRYCFSALFACIQSYKGMDDLLIMVWGVSVKKLLSNTHYLLQYGSMHALSFQIGAQIMLILKQHSVNTHFQQLILPWF